MALPPVVLKNLGDKLYDKRKSAALEIEQANSLPLSHSQSFSSASPPC